MLFSFWCGSAFSVILVYIWLIPEIEPPSQKNKQANKPSHSCMVFCREDFIADMKGRGSSFYCNRVQLHIEKWHLSPGFPPGIFLMVNLPHREPQTHPFCWSHFFTHLSFFLIPSFLNSPHQFQFFLLIMQSNSILPQPLFPYLPGPILHVQTHQDTRPIRRVSNLLRTTLLRRQLV